MMSRLALSTAAILTLISGAWAGNTSSNSSSNSSNGVHTRVDTIITDDGRRTRFYERRIVRERVPYRYRSKHQWHRTYEDDND
jgi:hypothetical protein